MADFSTTTSQGWGSRLKNSIGGIIFGLILVGGAFIALWLNEGRSVHRYQDLKDGKGKVVSIGSEKIDAANEGKLVHFSGATSAGNTPGDATFGVTSEGALKLRREVEMYQWKESTSSSTRKKTGGGTETTKTYSYDKVWSGDLIRSGSFQQAGHDNPTEMPFPSTTETGSPITVGAFTLSDSLVNRLDDFVPLPLASLDGLAEAATANAKLHQSGLYFGEDPAAPTIGDTRVTFSTVQPGDVSIVSQQNGQTLIPYQAKHNTVELLQSGIHAAEAMFAKAETDNKVLTWILRLVGFLAMGFGFILLSRPITVVADVLPFVGNIVGAGLGFIMFLLAGVLSFITIAIAWIAYRPVIGISLLVVAGFLAFLIIKKTRAASPQVAATDGPPPLV